MLYRLRFIAIAVLLTLASVRAAGAATPIFLLDSNVGGPTVLFQVDPTNGQLTLLGTVSTGPEEALGLAAASQSLLYVATYAGDILAVTIDPFTVTSTGCVGPGAIVGLAFSNGVLYATEERTSTLSRIDVSSCTTTLIGTVTVPIQGGDIAENGSGQWYLWTNSTQDLYLLDVTTAVAVELDPTNQNLGAKSGLAFDYQGGGTLFASSGGSVNSLLTLNPATGQSLASVPFSEQHRFGDLASPRCTDVDGDGFSPEGGPCGPVDCDDSNPHIHPGAPEVCNNVDDNCDGTMDEEPAASASCVFSRDSHDEELSASPRHDDEDENPSEEPSAPEPEFEHIHAVCVTGSCTIIPPACADPRGCPPEPDECDTDTDCPPGQVCHPEEGCVSAAAPCALPSGALACTPGSDHRDQTCAAEWFVDNPYNPGGVLSMTQVCRQGDSTCDYDASAATCTFHVAACLRVPDPRLPTCTPSDVLAYSLQVLTESRGPGAASALLAALQSVPGARTRAKRGRSDVRFSPPLGEALCTDQAPVVVPVGGRTRLRGTATTVTGLKDSDTLQLRCLRP